MSLPDSMKRAMAKQAEAERERRAKIVNTEGEFQAAEKMVQAATSISKEPIALQLRSLQTMREISSEHNTTTFLPVPIDLFAPFLTGASALYGFLPVTCLAAMACCFRCRSVVALVCFWLACLLTALGDLSPMVFTFRLMVYY